MYSTIGGAAHDLFTWMLPGRAERQRGDDRCRWSVVSCQLPATLSCVLSDTSLLSLRDLFYRRTRGVELAEFFDYQYHDFLKKSTALKVTHICFFEFSDTSKLLTLGHYIVWLFSLACVQFSFLFFFLSNRNTKKSERYKWKDKVCFISVPLVSKYVLLSTISKFLSYFFIKDNCEKTSTYLRLNYENPCIKIHEVSSEKMYHKSLLSKTLD